MLNEKGMRELAYVVRIDGIEPITGSDHCEAAIVGGWRIMVHKGTFEPGDLAIYFEIDSHLDYTRPEFEFLAPKHGNVKTQRYTFGGKGNFTSQGLLMEPQDFGWIPMGFTDSDGTTYNYIDCGKGKKNLACGDFLTEMLDVTYAVPEDNVRKSNNPGDPSKSIMARHPKFAKTKFARFMMRHTITRKVLCSVLAPFSKKKKDWPAWVKKTDEERVENMSWILGNKEPWLATEKIDGSSTTFTMKRSGLFKKYKFYVCSRNVVFDRPDKECYYDTNIYWEMAYKYNIESFLRKFLNDNPKIEWVTLQGETYGSGVQKRDYSMTDGQHDFAGFNFITSTEGRWNSARAAQLMEENNVPWVPILNETYILPDTIDELRDYVNSEASRIDGEMKEGIVFRSVDGSQSFKCVSPDYLLKYHM